MLIRKPRRAANTSTVEKAYADIIKDSFPYSPNNRKKILKAIVLYNENKFKRAIKKLERLLKICRGGIEISAANFFIALCYEEQGIWSQAIEHYLEVIRYNPKNDTALSNLGLIYKKNGKFIEALEFYNKAIEVSPGNAFAYNNLAVLYLDMMETDNAIIAAEEALKIKPSMYQAMNTLAMAYALKKDKHSAEKYYKQSILNGCSDAPALREIMKQVAENVLETQDDE